jgi:hypothetical protein
MDQQTNKQEPSSTEGGEMKVGDKVWVLATVELEEREDLRLRFQNGWNSWAPASDCRPVEPSNDSEIPDSSSDPINPSHYKQGGIECIEAMKVALGGGFLGYLRGNAIKYLWRYDKKNGVEDLKKARWYLDRLIREVGE